MVQKLQQEQQEAGTGPINGEIGRKSPRNLAFLMSFEWFRMRIGPKMALRG